MYFEAESHHFLFGSTLSSSLTCNPTMLVSNYAQLPFFLPPQL